MAISTSRTISHIGYRSKEEQQQQRYRSSSIAAPNFTLEEGVAHFQDMDTHGLLPDGGVGLPPNVGGPLPIHPKHKAIILYFMFSAQIAESETEKDGEINALHDFAHIVASSLLEKVYRVDVHPDSIKSYYQSAIANAQAVGKWNQHAVAEIISGQVQDQKTFDEVTSFLKTVDQRHWNTLSLGERWFLRKTLKATSGAGGSATTYIQFESYWLGAVNSKYHLAPLIRDPEIPLSRKGMDLKIPSNLGGFHGFEDRLSHARRRNTDD